MSNVISIKNLNFSYSEKQIFNDLNVDIQSGDFITLLGANGSGKSTLIKILSGLLKFDGEIFIDNIKLEPQNYKKIRQKIGLVFSNIDNQIVSEKVFDNIAFALQNLGVKKTEIISSVTDITNKLNISYLLKENIFNLSKYEKILVVLASVLIYKPNLLILDEALSDLDNNDRIKILKMLKTIDGMTIINITQNTEDILYGEKIIVLDEGKIVEYDTNENVFKNDRIFSKLGLSLPFMVDLSIKLKYYNLIDKIIYDMDEMVDILWK